MRIIARLALLLLPLGLWEGPALAQEPTAPEEGRGGLPWKQTSGRGIGLGLDASGSATAREWAASVNIPLSWLFALRFRPVLHGGFEGTGWSVGGKTEGIVRSRVLMNFVRVYAGGGPALFYGLSGANRRQVDGNWFAGSIDGNWFAGAEIFFDHRVALHWEFGSSGGAFDSGAGPFADVGVVAYLF